MNIIITGASSGIGYETAKVLCLNNRSKIIVIARRKDKLSLLKEECRLINPGSEIIPIVFDLTASDLTLLLNEIKKHVNSLDYLINNAGILVNKSFSETTYNDLFETFNTNFFSIYKITQILLPLFNAPAHIVNIGSMGGFQGSSKFSGLSVYSASKAALANFTECIAEELKEKGIKINCLALGSVQTEMLDKAFPGYQAPVSAIEMAEYVANFTLNGHKFYNGKILPVSVTTP